MPHEVPLRQGDPRRVGRYRLTGRLEGIPSDDPIFVGTGPDGADVCVSVLAGEWDAAARDRFAAEAAVAKRVPPFCAARVLDAGLDGGDAYLVSEYVRGSSLLEIVAEDGVRNEDQLEALAIGMATGLASVHQAGLVHGSFGPQYVIVGGDGPPRVVEFGITPPYGSATPSADMLAWAQTVVFAATGRPPSETPDLDALPDHLREPVRQCQGLEPAERPSARAVVQFLLGGNSAPRAGILAEGSRRAAQAYRSGGEPSSPQPRQSLPGPARPRAAGPDRFAASRQYGDDEARAAGLGPRGETWGRPPGQGPRASHHPPARGSVPRPGRSAAGADTDIRGHAQHHAVRAASGRRVRRWLVAGAGVVAVLVGLLIVYFVQSGGQTTGDRLSASTSPPSGKATSSKPTASSTPAGQGPVTPTAFGGTWSGQVTQPPTDTYNVTMTLTAGQTAGTISYAGASLSTCSGQLTVTSASSTTMTMSQGMAKKGCSSGTVSITLTGSGSVSFSFQGTPQASGTLTRR